MYQRVTANIASAAALSVLVLGTAACKTTLNLGDVTDTSTEETDGSSGGSTSSTDGTTSTTGTTTADTVDTTGATTTTDGGTTEGKTTGPDTTEGTTTTDGSTGVTDASTTDVLTTDASTTGSTTDASTTDASTTGSTTDASTTDATTTDGSTTGDVDPGCGVVPADMACVPANTYEMGTSLATFQGLNIFPYEKPGHSVTISKSFWMDLTEVTVEDYAVCWALKVCELPMQGKDLNWGVPGREKHPANGVNWYQAKTYCEWKGKRLPTEAEWELAARGDDGRMYPWGNEMPDCDHVVSNYCGTQGTAEVGSKPLSDSPYGLHDMGGNVLEWCADYYQEDYYYVSPEVDPKGPADGTKRVLRSWGVFVQPLNVGLQRVTFRGGGSPLGVDTNPAVMGFRCAQTPP